MRKQYIATLNEILRSQNYSFRVLHEMPALIGEGSQFVARVFAGEMGIIFIDSNLERYLLRHGKFYLCTNFDLMGRKEAERSALILELSGCLIF